MRSDASPMGEFPPLSLAFGVATLPPQAGEGAQYTRSLGGMLAMSLVIGCMCTGR